MLTERTSAAFGEKLYVGPVTLTCMHVFRRATGEGGGGTGYTEAKDMFTSLFQSISQPLSIAAIRPSSPSTFFSLSFFLSLSLSLSLSLHVPVSVSSFVSFGSSFEFTWPISDGPIPGA